MNLQAATELKVLPVPRDVPIERRLFSFVQELIEKEDIDLIVCSERKGTAVMRALLEEIELPRLAWSWDRVVSTAAINEFDWTSYPIKRILFFDELVHHGHSMKRAKEEIVSLANKETEIVTAGFAVWNRCEQHPDFSYYASVDIVEYEQIRSDIIEMLQRFGSLLLDTEHLELSVRINCGIKEFYHALARASENGNAFSFLSGSDRLNLTIRKPDILDANQLAKWVPLGSNTTDVVAKCRVLEKDHSHFSIMPIFYPSTRCVIDEHWVAGLPEFIERRALVNPRPAYIFYIVGLLASVEVLKSIVAALSDLIRAERIVLETPKECFTHLKAMFPGINTEGLWEYVKSAVAESKLRRLDRSAKRVEVQHVPEETIRQMSYFLITEVLREMDDREWERDWDPDLPRGLTWAQLTKITEASKPLIDVDPRWWSIVPDRLIDGGILHTDVAEVTSSAGEPWAVRIFGPDSEVVAEKLRRQIAVRGAKWLPTI